ncbi:MAG: hypothetical protein AB8H80_05070 [Planctomycetota bacterium]
MLDSIADALGDRIVKIAASPRMRGPTTTADGQYTVCMRGPEYREVGLVVYRQSVPAADRPVFWINLEGGEQAAVVAAAGGGLERQDMPADWIASDYLAHHGDDCAISFVALNPRRTLRQTGRGRLVADSAFLAEHPVTGNVQARALFRFEAASETVEVLALTVHKVRDRVEAGELLGLLEPLFEQPAP